MAASPPQIRIIRDRYDYWLHLVYGGPTDQDVRIQVSERDFGAWYPRYHDGDGQLLYAGRDYASAAECLSALVEECLGDL